MPSAKLIARSIPFVLFISLCLFLYRGLSLDPHKLPSVLLDKPISQLNLPLLKNTQISFSSSSMKGKVWLLNVWATWCNNCQQEHPVLMDIARSGVVIVGLDYKDDNEKAKHWLDGYGDPYYKVISDIEGDAAIDLGVYGAPETYVIDKEGVIRYKHIGEITPAIWQEVLEPALKRLEKA